MKNLFLEGPIQTGKSTLIREMLGDQLSQCGGFTSQRLKDERGTTCGFRIGPAATTELTALVTGFRPGPATAAPFDQSSDAPFFPTTASTPAAPLSTASTPAAPLSTASTPAAQSPHAFPAMLEYLLCAPGGSVYSGVFKYFDRLGRTHTDQEVFDILGTFYLSQHSGKSLILLDEIGGSELLSDSFRNALYELLDSLIPCLGVIKLEENTLHMQRAYDYGEEPSIADRNRELRQYIEADPGSACLYYERTESGDSPQEIAVREALHDFIDNVFSK